MKLLKYLLILTLLAVPFSFASGAQASEFNSMFENHGVVMLIIDPVSADILHANKTAASFYGYSAEELRQMKISQLNVLSEDEIRAEMAEAEKQNRNFFMFRHRLKNNEIRHVEVYSYPVVYEGRNVLFSIVHDVTKATLLEEKESRNLLLVQISALSFIVILLYLIVKLLVKNRKIKRSKDELGNFNTLRETFIDADERFIYLKDENMKYIFINSAMETFFRIPSSGIIGHTDDEVTDPVFAKTNGASDKDVISTMKLLHDKMEYRGRKYKTTKFPVKMLNGYYGVGAYIRDITVEEEQAEKREKNTHRHMILAEALTNTFVNRQEQLDYILKRCLQLTESEYGYIYLYDETTTEFTLNSWTEGVMADCTITNKQTKYRLESTGLWGEAVRRRKPLITNDFAKPDPLKKGYPKGHVELRNFMTVPVIIDDTIVAVVGLANKKTDYDENDIYEITMLMSGIWYAIERRDYQDQLLYERNKYLQTLVSIGDGILVVDRHGSIDFINTVAEALTGWTLSEAKGLPYRDVFVLSHEKDEEKINDPIEEVFRYDTIRELDNHAVLTSKNGTRYCLEDSAAPVKDALGETVGAVLVFRDVSEKKEQRKAIEYLSYHDALTGLYNRRFFEEELNRLDTKRNYPLAFIMGDVNGLKLTNDVFGHACGDDLLRNAATVLRSVSRCDDIVARWGGDEFVILLPKTNKEETLRFIERIKSTFKRTQFKAITGSISLGFDIKSNPEDDIRQIMINAEERMYEEKTLERSQIREGFIHSIITMLHTHNPAEKEHSEKVRLYCGKIGAALQLAEHEIQRLEKAGFLHDIGKVIFEKEFLCESRSLTPEDWNNMMSHPLTGYRILSSFEGTMDLAEYVLAHHEHWDGSGYPKNLSGESIPLFSRILSIAESYDRMFYDTTARKALNRQTAVDELKRNSATQFDPKIVDIFIEIIESSVI